MSCPAAAKLNVSVPSSNPSAVTTYVRVVSEPTVRVPVRSASLISALDTPLIV